jgi:uncharacterized membrane protein
VSGVLALPSGFPDVDQESLVYILIAGTGFAGALSLFLVAINSGHLSLITPIVACDGAIGALMAAASGAELAAVVVLGLGTIVTGTLVIAASGDSLSAANVRFSPTRVRPLSATILLAVMSAILFGTTFFAAGKAAGIGALWVVALSRGIAMACALLALWLRGESVLPPTKARPWLLVCGLLDVCGYVAFVIGATDDLPVAAVAASQYAAVTVIGGILYFGERLSRAQTSGVVVLLAGAALVAIGG